MFVFLKTQTIGGRDRLRPLPGQLVGVIPINENLNCSGDKSVRDSFPVGTIFATRTLTEASDGKSYRAGELMPFAIPGVQNGPGYDYSSDILDKWNRYSAHYRLEFFRAKLLHGIRAFKNKDLPNVTLYATLDTEIIKNLTSEQWPESNFDYAFVFFNIGSKVWQQLPPENIEVLNYN